ncbi:MULTISPECIES: hypothetical protein [unclassified Methanoculleus]|jgi:hypothetical protein
MFPEETLFSVVLDFFTIWMRGAAVTTSGSVKGIFSQVRRNFESMNPSFRKR